MSAEEKYVQELVIVTEELPPLPPGEEDVTFVAEESEKEDFSTQASLLDFGMNLMAKREPKPPRKPPSAVEAGALLSFVVGVTPQEREDVLYSLLLASRGASAAYSRFAETEAWYGKYLEILEKLGWSSEQFAFSTYEQATGELHIDQAALSVIGAIATQNQLAVLNQTLELLKGQAEDDEAMRLFDFLTTSQSGGNFQIGAVQKSEDGVLSMALGAFNFQSDDLHRPFLFLPCDKQAVQLQSAAQTMTFNAKHYASLRDAVEEKLGYVSDEYIADLEIA